MSHEVMPVRFRWLTPDEGGRLALPQGARFWATIEVEGHPFPEGEGWSVVLNELSNASDEVVGTIAFVSPLAPNGYLVPGSTFKLLEGPKPVAIGRVLDEKA